MEVSDKTADCNDAKIDQLVLHDGKTLGVLLPDPGYRPLVLLPSEEAEVKGFPKTTSTKFEGVKVFWDLQSALAVDVVGKCLGARGKHRAKKQVQVHNEANGHVCLDGAYNATDLAHLHK